MQDSYDDVSNIHRRYTLTLINPSSRIHSLALSLIVTTLLVATVVFGYLKSDDFIVRLAAVLAILASTQYLDSCYSKNKEYSKSLHMSLFGNILWLVILLSGILAVTVLSKSEASIFYVIEGMFLFAGFRIGLFTTVFGASMKKAWAACFIQPLAMFLVLVPMNLWTKILEPQTFLIGFTFLGIATVWSYLTDRAGKPGVKSTHKLVQAYLVSKSKNDSSEMESLMEEVSKKSKITTRQIRLCSQDNKTDFRMVIPEIHPGPFHPVGGSNIPYLIYKNMGSSAMVMHGVSDHSLNLPSQEEVESYLRSLTDYSVPQKGLTCTDPVTVQINKGRAVGLLFDKTAVLFLSLSPHGMEDIPSSIKSEIDQFSKNRNFSQVLIVDCHNAMGGEISQNNSEDLLKAAKSCLETLITKETYPLEFGYANSDAMKVNSTDLALGGLGVLCLSINKKKYFLGWADANNMQNGIREYVVNHFTKNGHALLEICTSDSHYSVTPARNKHGYYQFGATSKPQQIADWYLDIAKNAEKNINTGYYEILENSSNVKVMGSTIFQDYSKALDRALKITQVFALGTIGFFISTLFL